MTISRVSLTIVLTFIVCIAGAPMIQPFDEQVLSQAELAEELARSYEAFGQPEFNNYDSMIGNKLLNLERKSLDSLSGATFGGSKRFQGNTKQQLRSRREQLKKKNFDEIDRSNFDSFVKKNEIQPINNSFEPIYRTRFENFDKKNDGHQISNFDPIDRTGFDNYFQKLSADNHFASRQR